MPEYKDEYVLGVGEPCAVRHVHGKYELSCITPPFHLVAMGDVDSSDWVELVWPWPEEPFGCPDDCPRYELVLRRVEDA